MSMTIGGGKRKKRDEKGRKGKKKDEKGQWVLGWVYICGR